ncbi:MAG: YkgJ family cysteine cluster protein [Promethearchaeota archaeon]|nr:MAG: YkgJ family cysteine cluster protein [Candidatus Lokiarchaeota archaeon]
MTEDKQKDQDTEKDEEQKINNSENETTEEEAKREESKAKFTFKCTRCDKCCLERGPIPITISDLELWARNGVIANFLPYLDIYNKPDGGMDLILKPLAPAKEGEEAQPGSLKEVPIKELLQEKCPLYNKEQKKCLVYENRPLSCRTYPLEFDGKNFSVVDVDCPGVGEEGMTKEELKEMRDTAKRMYYELTRIRIALPVLNQIITGNFMRTLMQQQMEVMSSLSEEDKEKLDEILKKGQETNE